MKQMVEKIYRVISAPHCNEFEKQTFDITSTFHKGQWVTTMGPTQNMVSNPEVVFENQKETSRILQESSAFTQISKLWKSTSMEGNDLRVFHSLSTPCWLMTLPRKYMSLIKFVWNIQQFDREGYIANESFWLIS